MSKAKKNSVKTQSGDPFTRWLVVGMVALVVAVGAFFFFTTENKESNASLVALDNFSPIGEFEAVVDPAQGDGIVFNALKIFNVQAVNSLKIPLVHTSHL
jgi:hypothetical protein